MVDDIYGTIFTDRDGGKVEMKRFFCLWVFAVAMVFISGCGFIKFSPSQSSLGSVGETLTTEQRFTLKNLKGEDVSLDSVLQSHKVVLLNFWATWCGYCVEEMPDLVKLQNDFGARGFTVLALDMGESAEQAASFAVEHGLNFPIVLDTEITTAQKYGIVGIPVSILLDSTGKVLGQYNIYNEKLRADVEAAVNAS